MKYSSISFSFHYFKQICLYNQFKGVVFNQTCYLLLKLIKLLILDSKK